MLKLALPRAEGDARRRPATTMSKDMDITGLFQLLDPASFPAQLQSEGLGFSSALWSQVGAQAVIKMKVAGGALEGRVYISPAATPPSSTKSYRAADVRDAVHEFANDVVKSFTGQPGVFGSRIALAMTGHGAHEIAVVDMDGGRTAVVTKMGSDSLLPAFSPTGGEIAFTSYLRNNPDLYVVSAGGGRARRVSKQPGLNTGAAWAPERPQPGAHHVVRGELRDLPDRSRRRPRRGAPHQQPGHRQLAVRSRPTASQIAFVSNRQGSPQIFVMSASGGGAKRVTFQGKYNQTPRWSPRADKPQIAFTGRDERGVFDIFILDVKSGKIDRLTQGQGLEPRPDLVARRAPAGVRVEPRRALRPEPRDPPRGAGLAGQRLVPLLGPGPGAADAAQASAAPRRCESAAGFLALLAP